jgi:hypothetical protein
MVQQGQVFKLDSKDVDAGVLWAYRYRTGGRGSKRSRERRTRVVLACETAALHPLEKLLRDTVSRSPSPWLNSWSSIWLSTTPHR